MEQDAVEVYKVRPGIERADSAAAVVQSLVTDEETHFDEFDKQLDNIKRFSPSYLASVVHRRSSETTPAARALQTSGARLPAPTVIPLRRRSATTNSPSRSWLKGNPPLLSVCEGESPTRDVVSHRRSTSAIAMKPSLTLSDGLSLIL